MRADELLVLNYAGFSRHVGNLFARLGRSRGFRDIFLRDPTGVTWKLVFPGYPHPTPSHISAANRFLFSLLSNDGFLKWGRDYQERLEAEARKAIERSVGEAERDLEATRLDAVSREEAEAPESGSDLRQQIEEAEFYNQVVLAVNRQELYTELISAIQQHADAEMLHSIFAANPGIIGYPSPEPGPTGPNDCPDLAPKKPGLLPDLCPDPKPPDPLGIAGDTWATHETVAVHEVAVVAFAVVAVVVAVTQIDVTPKPMPPTIPRSEIQKLSAFFADEIAARAEGVRGSGILTDPTRFGTEPGL